MNKYTQVLSNCRPSDRHVLHKCGPESRDSELDHAISGDWKSLLKSPIDAAIIFEKYNASSYSAPRGQRSHGEAFRKNHAMSLTAIRASIQSVIASEAKSDSRESDGLVASRSPIRQERGPTTASGTGEGSGLKHYFQRLVFLAAADFKAMSPLLLPDFGRLTLLRPGANSETIAPTQICRIILKSRSQWVLVVACPKCMSAAPAERPVADMTD
ncbi:hypothetical protein KC361_g13 [Hortaea werneckii]|nr:hypothetical protein KC361_g13 [Hortaea werneckii]